MSEWQPIETAPKDRPILLDLSWWLEGRSEIVESYEVGLWYNGGWTVGEYGVYLDEEVNGWIDIPKSRILPPYPTDKETDA